MIIAHRGISFDLPENSLPAFNASWDKGVDGIEGDFHLTKDGAIVCIHDDDTQRVCNQKLIVKDSTLAELKQLNLSHKISNNSKVKIPTLAEVLNVLPYGKKIQKSPNKDNLIISPNLGVVMETRLLAGSTLIHLSMNVNEINFHLHARIPGLNFYKVNEKVKVITDVKQIFVFKQ